MKVLFTSFALPGHFIPLVGLAWGFRAAGHEVRVAVADRFATAALRSGLPVTACGPTADFVDMCAGAPDGTGEGARVRGRAFGMIAAQTAPGIERVLSRWRPDLVVSERAEFAGPVVAARCGIPHVQLHWGVAPLGAYREAGAEAMGCPLPVPDAVVDPWPPSLRLPHARTHLPIRHVPSNGGAGVPPWVHDERRPVRVALTLGTLLPRLDPGAWSTAASALACALPGDAEVVVATDGALPRDARELPGRVRHAGRPRSPRPSPSVTCSSTTVGRGPPSPRWPWDALRSSGRGSTISWTTRTPWCGPGPGCASTRRTVTGRLSVTPSPGSSMTAGSAPRRAPWPRRSPRSRPRPRS